jgi:hypothetical protein
MFIQALVYSVINMKKTLKQTQISFWQACENVWTDKTLQL